MTKKSILAVVVVFLTWSIMDFIIHGLLLGPSYQATALLWRAPNEMKMGLIYLAVLVSAAIFVAIYARFSAGKDVHSGFIYGLLFGTGTGISAALGTFAVMPIPFSMALIWFLGTLAETALGGIILGAMLRDQRFIQTTGQPVESPS